MTALFADVVGSTALAERHDPEEARLIVGEAIARAVRIVESYGGTVKDLAGDGMLALFGAPVAHEDDPERALRAGLEIAAAIEDYAQEVRRGWGIEGFGIRLGAETGEVVVGEVGAGSRVEYGATGDAVNVAARLQAMAEPGAVLAGPAVRRLAEERFRWGEPRPLNLKGKDEPVVASRALGPADVGAPARSLAPFTGRAREMGRIRESLGALSAGRGGIVFVSGEPGIGKSRLTLETREAALGGGAVWLEGRAVSYGAALAWWPVRDLLRGWLGVGTQEPELRVRLALRRRLEEALPGRGAALQPYLAGVLGLAADPESAALLGGLSPEALQFQTYEVITELVEGLAARGPLAWAIDDLHWADSTTLGLLERLLPIAETSPVLFFFNHRPETAHPSWALRERAAREFRHLVTILDLEPLDEQAERDLLAALGEGALSPDLAARIIDSAEGNPLFLEELARAAGESTGAGLPSTLEGVILARLDRLEPAWREIVTAASACGRSFSFGLLEAVTREPEASLRPALHHLLRLDLMQEERRWPDASYRFKHALIQEAAYRTLVTSRRRELHARAATWLEERYADGKQRVYGLLAHHWTEADDSEQAAVYLRLAGEQALQEWALGEAVEHLQALVATLRRSGRETEAARPLFQLASTLHLGMRFAEANEAWQEAFDLWRPAPPAPERTATLHLGVNRVPWEADPFRGYYAANLRLAEQLDDALFVLRPGPSIEPLLAHRLEVEPSGLRYRVHMLPGLTFNSGRRLDAATVVESLRTFLQISGDATVLWAVAGGQELSEGREGPELGIRALDPLTVEIDLWRHDPAFPLHLTQPHAGAALPGEGTGPYRLVEMTGDLVAIEAEPAYPRPTRGNLRRVEWHGVRPAEATQLLVAGKLDAIASFGSLPSDPLPPALGEEVGPPLFLVGFWPLWGGLPVDDALRRALALGLDRSLLEPHLLRHQQVATGGIVPPGLPGHTPGAAPAFDPDAARAWLARSSHQGPLLVGHYVEARYGTLQVAMDCWRDVLGLDVQGVPTQIHESPEITGQLHVIQMNWVAHVPDPEYFLKELLYSKSRGNLGGVADPELDLLIERAEAATDGSTRLALYHEADRYATGRGLMIPVFYGRMFAVLQPWVRGWWEWGNPNQLFSELEITPDSPRYAGG